MPYSLLKNRAFQNQNNPTHTQTQTRNPPTVPEPNTATVLPLHPEDKPIPNEWPSDCSSYQSNESSPRSWLNLEDSTFEKRVFSHQNGEGLQSVYLCCCVKRRVLVRLTAAYQESREIWRRRILFFCWCFFILKDFLFWDVWYMPLWWMVILGNNNKEGVFEGFGFVPDSFFLCVGFVLFVATYALTHDGQWKVNTWWIGTHYCGKRSHKTKLKTWLSNIGVGNFKYHYGGVRARYEI